VAVRYVDIGGIVDKTITI